MKKEYSSPEFELVEFKFEDIILTGSLDDTPELLRVMVTIGGNDMKNTYCLKSLKRFSGLLLSVFFIIISTFQISAASYETDGFVYSVSDGNASVTGYKGDKTDIVLPLKLQSWSVSEISDFAFVGKTAITSVRLNEARYLRRIGTDSFYGCTSLESISIPIWVRDFGAAVFQNCTSLKSVTFNCVPSKITDQMFYNCTSLDKVYLPAGTSAIGKSAFAECASLSEVYIPTSVTSIASNAFRSSPNVTIKGSYGSYAEEYAKANNISFKGISAYDVGDVNMDGRIDILDATLIQKYVVGIVELSAEQKHLADYNNDGDITVVDATEIQKFIVHLN